MDLAKTFLAVGIAIVFAVFVSYGLSVIYQMPKDYSYAADECYRNYNCEKKIIECQKQYNYSDPEYQDCYLSIVQSVEYKTCRELFDKCFEDYQRKTPQYIYERNSFYILFAIGVLAIIAGYMLLNLEIVGSGLLGGGILVVVWSIASSWQYLVSMDKYVKLSALGFALAILIYLGYKKFEKNHKK